MRRGALALCLVVIGCGSATPRPVPPGFDGASEVDCEEEGCLDWMPEPARGWTIYGYVLDRATHEPVSDATIIATDRVTHRSARVATNALGQFNFGSLAAGRYDVMVISSGRASDRWPDVVLDAGRRTALRIHLGSTKKIDLDDRLRVRRVSPR